MQRQDVNVLILGAGATGLGAAYRLRQLNVTDWIIVEAKGNAGGLASSFADGHGFTWDIGGHVQFSHYDEYDQMALNVLGHERKWHNRKALISLGTRMIPYPFQCNLHRLDTKEQQRAISGLEKATKYDGKRPSNFLEWIFTTFGHGIAELFMVPYNMKVWGVPLELLDYAWIGDRVAIPSIEEIRKSVDSNLDDADWGPNRKFWYPLFGGTGSIWSRLASQFEADKIRFGVGVSRINLRSRTAILSDGTVIHWKSLISSLPIDVLCNLCEELPPEISNASRQLVYNSCEFIGIGLKGETPEELKSVSWIYFPSEFSPYYRITILSNYSPYNAPVGCWSVLAEVTHTPFHPLPLGDLATVVLDSLCRDGLVSRTAAIVSVWRYSAVRGYPLPSLGRDKLLSKILPYLEQHKVYSRGRFGAWKYEVSNQDHCFMQGFELVNRLFIGGEELTVLHPEVVNGRGTSAPRQP